MAGGGDPPGPVNEPVLSEETHEALSRVGRALGEREGTGPEDDRLLRQRGIAVPPNFPAHLDPRYREALRAAPEDRILGAASAADSFADSLARLVDPGS